jgi:acetyltransferase (GNAT) family protein
MSISVSDCPSTLIPELRAFFSRVYGPSHVLSDGETFLRWQFGRCSSDVCTVKVVWLNNRIAGCLGYVPVDVALSGGIIRGAWVINWIVDQDVRRLGLGPMLMRDVTREFELTLNLGPNAEARDVLRRMRWTTVGELPRYVIALDAEAATLLMEEPQRWPLTAAVPVSTTAVRVRRVGRFSASATELWNRFQNRRVAGARRSCEFLNWRYADHPSFEYRLFEAYYGDELGGIAVYRLERVQSREITIGRILELVSIDECGQGLLHAVIEDSRPEAVLLDFFSAFPAHRVLLRDAGFAAGDHPAAASIPIVFQPIDRQRNGIWFLAELSRAGTPDVDWYVTKGDADQDRPTRSQTIASEVCDSITSA